MRARRRASAESELGVPPENASDAGLPATDCSEHARCGASSGLGRTSIAGDTGASAVGGSGASASMGGRPSDRSGT